MRKCDLVMKGGITSGIVYPAAVCELAREFQFVNIGGTSAGAIAAADYRRSEAGSNAGFEALADLPRWLAERDGDRSRLLGLFQPAPALASLYDVALEWIASADAPAAKIGRVMVALLRSFRRIALPVAAAGA